MISPIVRFILGFFVFILTLGLLSSVAAVWWGYSEFKKPLDYGAPVTVIIPKGANIGDVAGLLMDKEVIDYPFIFNYGGRMTGQASKIKAGEYDLEAGLSMHKILDKFEDGDVVQRNVTIREGLTSYEIVQLLSGIETLTQQEIEVPAEGSLLAETYSYPLGEPVSVIIARMQAAMNETMNELWDSRADDLPIKTKEEALVLASIVEKETSVAEERARVAGVFINRLKIGMPLQTDPTVIYALTEGRPKNDGQGPLGRRLLRKDLEFESPYNTYLHPGLPPGPICNPGPDALRAVLQPENHDYLFFVADGTGGHSFAKTLSEHNQNVAKWRKVRSAE